MYVVGVTKACKRLAFCASLNEAETYVTTLPRVEEGHYYIDGPCNGPIVVATVDESDVSGESA